MKRTAQLVLTLAVAAAIAFAGGPAVAQVATMSYGGSAVTWSPVINAEGIMLTVAGNGRSYRMEFAAGRTLSFDIFQEGQRLPDGLYKWELRPIMSRAQIEAGGFAQGRVNADGSAATEGVAPRVEIQSGTFRVVNGTILDPAAAGAEPAAGAGGGTFIGGEGDGPRARGSVGPLTADFVINDDLIVDGSACIGFDCVNGESFGFDTIRLKENNLRIKADDTSVAASFPRNDWQLTFNESANGGASKFSVEDISGGRTPFTIEANARSHSLYVDDGGRIGSRTSTPSTEIHTIDGDTPTLRLQQDGSSGFAPQTWDLAGNETNFFVRDVTNGSTLPFRIRPGAPTSSIFIDVSGDVAIGHSSPTADLDITDSGTANIKFASTGGNGQIWNLQTDASSNNFAIRDASGTAANVFVIEEGFDAEIMRLNASGQVVVQGTPVHPDYVFEPDYALESIEDHAEFMFTQKHLPAVGAGTYTEDGKPFISLGDRSQGMLEELEKAHVYIAQLNEELGGRASEVEELKARVESRERQLEEVLSRLAELEQKLDPR